MCVCVCVGLDAQRGGYWRWEEARGDFSVWLMCDFTEHANHPGSHRMKESEEKREARARAGMSKPGEKRSFCMGGGKQVGFPLPKPRGWGTVLHE